MNEKITIGQSSATVVARSINAVGDVITSWELEFPRFITPEILRHRSFSFCQQSSRATPTKVLLDQVRNNPAFFDELGVNKSGMTADETLTPSKARLFELAWMGQANIAANFAEEWAAKGVHKQVINRILEPFMRTKMLVTATDTDGFFRQRISKLAQPEIRNLAKAMLEARNRTEPEDRCEHIPYDFAFTEEDYGERIIRGVAASARVCVGRHDGKPSTYEQDWKLVKMLFDNNHMSPFEHVAFREYLDAKWANLRGWRSMRNRIESESRKQVERWIDELNPNDA